MIYHLTVHTSNAHIHEINKSSVFCILWYVVFFLSHPVYAMYLSGKIKCVFCPGKKKGSSLVFSLERDPEAERVKNAHLNKELTKQTILP